MRSAILIFTTRGKQSCKVDLSPRWVGDLRGPGEEEGQEAESRWKREELSTMLDPVSNKEGRPEGRSVVGLVSQRRLREKTFEVDLKDRQDLDSKGEGPSRREAWLEQRHGGRNEFAQGL